MASTCAARVFSCALVLFALLSWFKPDMPVWKDGSGQPTPTPTEPSFVTPSSGQPSQPTTQTVQFEAPPPPCNDVPEIIEGAAKTAGTRLHPIEPSNIYVFSAFIDRRVEAEVLIIGATLDADTEAYADLLCLFVDGLDVWRSPASVEFESGSAGLTTNVYSVLIRCPLKSNMSTYAKVGLVFNYCDPSSVYLPIRRIPHPRHVAHSSGLELCVHPLPSHFDNTSQLVEFVELHRHLGVTHFNFYTPDNVSANVKMLLDSYAADGVASALTWNGLPSLPPPHSSIVAMQDCLYRRMNHLHPFLGFLSLHEAFYPSSQPYNSSLGCLLRTVMAKEFGRAAVRIRHRHPTSSARDFRSQPKSQWIVRSHLILSMQANWVGRYFRGVGYDVPARHALVRPLDQWAEGALSADLVSKVARNSALRKKR